MKPNLHALLILSLVLSLSPVAIADASSAAQESIYTVQPGDSLFRIALRFGTTVQAIQRANDLTSSVIYVGQELSIPSAAARDLPSASTYTVKTGDTLFRIARNHNTTISAIQQANGITSELIYAGQILTLPGGAATQTAAFQPSGETNVSALPGGGSYTVRTGDTLWRIAANNGTTVDTIRQLNGLTSSTIYRGQVLALPGPSGQTAPATGGTGLLGNAGSETATVVNVVDGDTIDVVIGGNTHRVRYIGINTPESDEACGSEATAANAALANGRTVTLSRDVSETDRYGRLLRYVYVGDLFVNAKLVAQGYAESVRYPPDTSFADYFDQLQAGASQAGIGCWPTGVFDGVGGGGETQAPQQGLCDPSYPSVCVPPPPPDLDCGEISYRNFIVVGSDPHRFDGDNDGVGCER